ncbi:MAG: V-type ATP synthase subunit I [Candidatus Hydrothermarchaeaceae archaeon]
MIKPVEMKKFSAVILEEKKDAVLRELKERGIIHLMQVEESDISEFDLAPGKTHGINVQAGEYLSKIDGMLDVFELAKDEGVSLIKKLKQEPVPPVEVREVPLSELFEKVNEKLADIEDRVFGISSRLEQLQKERDEISNAGEIISKLRFLNVGPKDVQDFESTFTTTGTILAEDIPALRDDISEVTDLFYLHSVDLNKKDSMVLITAWKEFEADIRRVLHIRRLEEFRVPAAFSHLGLEEAVARVDSELSRIKNDEDKLLSEVKELKDAEKQDLLLMREALQIEKLLDETNTFFGNTATTFLLRGWVSVGRTDELVGIIDKASDGHCVTLVEDTTKGDEHPPTLLENSKIAKPMELLSSTYGTPSYGMVDPSFFMTLTFPLLFGFMFGDVGQGLVLALVGYLLGFYFKVDEALRNLGRILLYCGLAAIGGGFLYGEFFGLEGIVPALWLHPLHSIMELMTFSFYLGLVHISLGCFVKIYDEISHGQPLHAIFNPWGVTGLWFLWGSIALIMNNGIDGALWLLFGLFSPDTAGASLAAVGPLMIAPVILIVAGGKFVEGLGIAWSLYEAYEAVTRYIFNMISYVRIAALAIIHAVFANLMNTGLDSVSGISSPIAPILWIMILVGANLFIIALEVLISFIHTLRLHYYEWFSKFYLGEGTPFVPFVALRKYTVPARDNSNI